ncbi:MAG: phosphate ABC transporter substrate-binding protein PstS [Pyrinomonadaceae bacterium MAG19_C2-C3]|nr:phosphate ABC transporter substrate-binding protein PstS [Pyrinomonadaceae bacterium MAG19_C2-C3]
MKALKLMSLRPVRARRPSHGTLRYVAVALAAFMLLGGAACNPNRGSGTGSGAIQLRGAGSTFIAPLMQKWTSEFNKTNPGVRADYQSTGSGAAIQGVQERTIDFGGSDAPMTDEALIKSPDILHIPVVLGAVVISYNLPQMSEPLRFSPDVLADIFLGNITRWDDARIRADNPNVSLPATEIGVVHRSDGSGTTDIFTDYLSKVSPQWKAQVGRGTSVKWATGVGGKGNEGVTGVITQTPNTIGYVEAIYAKQRNLPIALIKNRAGNFVLPSPESVANAAIGALPDTPEDLRVSVTDSNGAEAYPIAGYTYVLAYRNQSDSLKGKALVDFLWWAIHNGIPYSRALEYTPLPDEMVRRAEAKINSISAGGRSLRQ